MKVTDLSKKMILAICALSLGFIAASVIYYRTISCLPFVLGAVLGAAVSVFKVKILQRAVDKALEMDEKTAANYIRLQYLLRLFLTAGVLVLAALVPYISLWGAAAGVFSFQIALYFIKFSTKT